MARTSDTAVARAPGRVNLIGEHTDYNDGLCLAFAIEQGVTVSAQRRDDGHVEAHASDLGEHDRFALDHVERAPGWRAFVRGAVAELRAAGYAPAPATLTIEGDLARGSGLSSSAALEVALCLALLALGGERDPDRIELARLCSRVENEWVGAQTGLLDQLAVLLGRDGCALRLDLATLEARPVPLALRGWTLATVDSGADHAHADGAYNERRAECRAACERLGISSLRAATLRDAARLPAPLDRRVRHVVTENARVDAMVAALERADLDAAARLLDDGHASLRDDYEASVPAVERTVARLKDAGARGARMVGGGFGGHVLGFFAPGGTPPPGATVVRPAPAARVLS